MGDLKITGPWSMPDIETFFAQAAIPMRLSVISKAGWPVVLSLWFLFEDGVLKCASRGHSKVILFLQSNPRCGLEIAGESPRIMVCGVRVPPQYLKRAVRRF